MEGKEPSDVIESALNAVLAEQKDYEEGDMLIDWMVIGYVTNPDSEKESAYPMLYSNGIMPTYRARGLLHTALMYLDVSRGE